MSVEHYENFPVASLLCPAALRPAVAAIYWFARTADDLADEGDATAAQRLVDLADYRAELHAAAASRTLSDRWRAVFEPLQAALTVHALPMPPFMDLLSAFEQDVVQHRYAERTELLDYCRRSANSVGRLLLHLYGIKNKQAMLQSDAICTALQLSNFWQDLSVDTRRDRLYIPLADCERHSVQVSHLLTGTDGHATRTLIADLVGWARQLMLAGAPLVHVIPGRAGWELRLVVQGGLRVLEKIERGGYDTLTSRPVLNLIDAPLLLWRALWMRPTPLHIARESA